MRWSWRCYFGWAAAAVLTLYSPPATADQKRNDSFIRSLEVQREIDPYYTNIGLYISFKERKIPTLDKLTELSVYQDLIASSIIPDFLVLEASVNPLPLSGVYLKRRQQALYASGEVTTSLNLLQTLTTGFEEPAAISLFAGHVVRFGSDDEDEGHLRKYDPEKNQGYVGFLFSTGSKHIKENVLYNDKWYEIHWKIKGDRQNEEQRLSWSFWFGAKLHSHPGISDTLSLSIRRSRTDFVESGDDFFRNLGVEYQYDMLARNLKPARHYLLFEKNWPGADGETTYSLGFGGIYQAASRYATQTTGSTRNWSIMVRPNILF